MLRCPPASDLLSYCLRRIEELEPAVQAWVEVAPQAALADGPLRGVPFGAKDIFETAGMATEYGSALYRGRKGDRDAEVLVRLRKCGAVLVGKTHTTAFASFDPAPTRNPRAPGHTPGGSSAGSAAAVAAGMAGFTLGTQTLGSVLRPASYCGVCGFKPSFGLLPMNGVLAFAPSLDTAGLFTATAADMAWLWERSFGQSSTARLERAVQMRVASDDVMRGALDTSVEALRRSGTEVITRSAPEGWEQLTAAARAINDYEGARTHESTFRQFGDGMGARLAELIRRGLSMSPGEYEEARGVVARMRTELGHWFAEFPAILSPAATGAPPAGYASTGDPANNAPWTALGVPAISVPMPGTHLPAGLQITAAAGRDDDLAALGADAERRLAAAIVD